jgi:two-component system response regulator HydG
MLQEAPAEAKERKSSVLLIADDEEIIRNRLLEMSKMLGFKAYAAGDGVEAWDLYQQTRPNIVILDIYMPRMNGLAVMQKIKEVNPNCPVILITGFMHFEQLVQKSKIKPDGFITKPFTMNTVINAILKLVLDVNVKL